MCVYIYTYTYIWHTACGILASRPGINPTSVALEAQSFNQWTSRKVLEGLFK